ncbi:MAG: amidohydrolase family protein [Planctomycetota bacterium]
MTLRRGLIAAVLLSVSCLAGDGWIDTHVHIKPPTEGRKPGENPFTASAQALIDMMDANGVETSLVMPPPRGSEEQRALPEEQIAAVLSKHKGRLLFVGGGTSLNCAIHETDPSKVTKEVRAAFERDAEGLVKAGTRAFGEMCALHFALGPEHPFEQVPPDHPLFLLLADLAAKHDIPIDLHIEIVPEDMDTPDFLLRASDKNPKRLEANLERFEKLLSHNRKARVVWQHVGWDNTGRQTPELVRGLLERNPNLFAAIHGVGEAKLTKLGRPGETLLNDEKGALQPGWKKLIEEFPDRFLIGSDQFFGSDGYAERMPVNYDPTWEVLKQLPADLAKKVGRGNAARVYGLK